MDPLGLPFEMYNHAGLYRTTEFEKPVDTSGEIIDSGDPSLDGPVKNALEMIEKLANSERVEQVFVRHAFRFWMGRNETLHDRPVLQAAHKAYRESGGSMKALILSLVTSDAFLFRKLADGAIEVLLEENVQIGLQSRVQRGGFEARRIEFKMGDKQFSYDLPQNLYVKRTFKDAEAIRQWEERGRRPIMDGKLYLDPISDQLPTLEKPWIAGRFIREHGRFMEVQIGEEVFQIGTQGHDGQHRIMGLLSQKDIKPFVQQAFVHGKMEGDVFHAEEVCLRMLEDSKTQDDPTLGRYLFIGDSISGNYDKALRTALMGKLNIYHPPTNCGPVRKGVENIVQWLGAYDQPGLGWDVISFNFGQWDSANTNLVIRKIWRK
jgi:hypothetical protein